MQALAPEHVIYAGTASKTLAPAVRLGWLVVPRRMVADVVCAKERTDRHGSSLDELTLAEFITSGSYDRHVRHSRLGYQRRRDRLIAALARALPEPRVTGVAAGLHAVLHLPLGAGEDETVAAGAARGLVLDGNARLPDGRHRPSGSAGHWVRDAARARVHDRREPAVRGPAGRQRTSRPWER
jgi:GntR family transcriptional regulator / MocR family aminotransferase